MRTWPCLNRSSRVAYNFPVYIINEVPVKIFVVTTPSYFVLYNRFFLYVLTLSLS